VQVQQPLYAMPSRQAMPPGKLASEPPQCWILKGFNLRRSGVSSNEVHVSRGIRRRLSGYQSGGGQDGVGLWSLPPVNCPDLHYPRSRISMAFLAHLQSFNFTWIAWILDRERHNKGIRLDSTPKPWPSMRPRIMEPRGLVCVAWVELRNKWTSKPRGLPACCSAGTGTGTGTGRGMMSW
jgi:hypothetical protein